MTGVISTVAWFLALVLPFFLVRRWNGVGFVLAVLIGWAAIGLENEYLRSHDFVGIEGDEIRTAAVFCGVWLALGWGFMAVYCLFVGCLQLAWSACRHLYAGKAWKNWDPEVY